MMAMETSITKDGVTYKEVAGSPSEQEELEKSYEHLCKLRDEVIEMGIIPAIKDWHSLNPELNDIFPFEFRCFFLPLLLVCN